MVMVETYLAADAVADAGDEELELFFGSLGGHFAWFRDLALASHDECVSLVLLEGLMSCVLGVSCV
jgi:hypothetical protein